MKGLPLRTPTTNYQTVFQMLPPQVPAWPAPNLAHIAQQMSASAAAAAAAAAASVNIEKRLTPPRQTPSPSPQQLSDPDIPLNLTKPKCMGSASPSPNNIPTSMHSLVEQPIAATTPKLLPHNLVMPRAFMPYAGLPPQFSPMAPSGDRHKKDGLMSSDKQHHFPMHMYGLPAPPHLGGKPRDDISGKDEPDFMAHSEYTIALIFHRSR